jgi:hypothetical protein
MVTEDLARRSLLVGTGFAALAATATASRAAASSSAPGTVIDIALATDLPQMSIDRTVSAVRTTGYRVAGIGGALYVADDQGDATLPFLESRNGRRFFLSDDDLRAIRPEVLGALGDCAVRQSGNPVAFDGHDDSDAISAAIKIALRLTGTVVLSARRYRITKPLPPITGPLAIIGAGALKTWLMFDPAASGDAISVIETWMGKDAAEVGPLARIVAIPAGQVSGVTLAGFTLSGSRATRNRQNGLVLYERNDNVLISDVEVRHIKGRGFCSGLSRKPQPTSLLRESRIDRLQVRACGHKESGLPAFELSSDGYRPSDDSTNNLTITDLKVIYSSGRGIVIENRNNAHDMRYITIHGAYIEGADDALWTVKGSVTTLEVHGFECNGSRNPAVAALTFDADPKDQVTRPPRSCFFSGSFGPVENAIRVSSGKDLQFRIMQNGPSNAALIVERGCTGAIKFDGAGDERNWRLLVDPHAARFVTVEPGRKVWQMFELPDPASLINATIVIQDIGDGRAAFARSDGANWFFTPMEARPLPKPPAKVNAKARPLTRSQI